MDMHTHHELLSTSRTSVMARKPSLVSRIESGPGGDNSKSQLQTLITRAGYVAPTYKTKKLKNNQFRALNGVIVFFLFRTLDGQ